MHMIEPDTGDATLFCKQPCELDRFRPGTICNHDFLRTLFEQWQQDTSRGPAGTEQQNAFALEIESVILHQIAHQPDAVGIVTAQPAVFQHHDGIDGAGMFRLLAAFINKLPGALLERHRDIEPLASCLDEIAHVAIEIFHVAEDTTVLDILTGLRGEGGMDLWRFAVFDGIADDGVLVCHNDCVCRVLTGTPERTRVVAFLNR